jgi:predicted alpha/beta hydrolase family esterase
MNSLDKIELTNKTGHFFITRALCKIGQFVIKVFEFIKNIIFTIAYHTAFFILKAVVIPPIVALYCMVGLMSAVSAIIPQSTIHDHLSSLKNEFWEVGEIVFNYRLPNNGDLKSVSKTTNGPCFLLISPVEDKRLADATPILYAPGYLNNAETLRNVAVELANKTGSPVYLVSYKSLFQSIEEHSKDVGEVVDHICNDTGNEEIVLIGHSMGGLVTGHYIANSTDEKIKKIRKWITVASPLNGTNRAYFGIGKCARDMQPNSEFIKNFNQNERIKSVSRLHINSKVDHVVPFSRSTFETSETEFVSQKKTGHMSVRRSSEVVDAIVNSVKILSKEESHV